MSTLEIKDLHVTVEGKEILKGVNLTMKTGEIHAIMGPNGTGKSTLSESIMGNPAYKITQGDVLLDGESLLDKPVDERARLGLFLAMQYPAEIPGVTNAPCKRNGLIWFSGRILWIRLRCKSCWRSCPLPYFTGRSGSFPATTTVILEK